MAIERKFIKEAVNIAKVNKYLQDQLKSVGCGDIEIKRTPMGTRVIISAQKPGLVIGKKGKNIQMLTNVLKNRFKIDNPQLEVIEVQDPNLDAEIMAKQLASTLERGIHFRRAAYSMITNIMKAGALGAEIVISGKLSGSRARSEKFTQGYLKHCGETSNQYVNEATTDVILKAGTIGVRIKIVPPVDKHLLDQLGISEEQAEMVEEMPVEEEKEEKKTEKKPEKKKAEKKEKKEKKDVKKKPAKKAPKKKAEKKPAKKEKKEKSEKKTEEKK